MKGGSGLSNDQPVFNFELNESLYFEKGQEVGEIRGIALDPEISIQPFNEYISIRGVIELRGEYVRADEDEQDDTVQFADDYHARRYVEQVVDTEEGGTEFSHRFPVEISVPTYRVGDLEDVMVSIDSFDYELPNKNQISFTSTIAIHGISEQVDSPRNNAADEYPFADGHTFNFEMNGPREFDMPAKPESFASQDTPAFSDTGISDTTRPADNGESGSSDEVSSPDRWKHKKSQSFAEFFKQEPEPEPDPDPSPSASASSFSQESGNDAMAESPYASESPYVSESPYSVESSFSSASSNSSESSRESPSGAPNVVDQTWEADTFEFVESSSSFASVDESDRETRPNSKKIDSSNAVTETDENIVGSLESSIKAGESSRESQSDLTSGTGPNVREENVIDKQHSERPQINENAEEKEDQTTDLKYLSDMFRDEEERFSKMRVCIVQEKDTLETIADRYKISTLQLMKKNNLEDDTLTQGQLLYIPIKKQ